MTLYEEISEMTVTKKQMWGMDGSLERASIVYFEVLVPDPYKFMN